MSTIQPSRIIERETSATSSSASSASSSDICAGNNKSSFCEKPTGTQTLPIVLGIVIPLTIALFILIVLHRRHVKKLKKEDLDAEAIDLTQDDFEMAPRGGRGGLEKPSMMDSTSYLLPIEHNFNESILSVDSPYAISSPSKFTSLSNASYPALPLHPESIMVRQPGYFNLGSPYDKVTSFAPSMKPSRRVADSSVNDAIEVYKFSNVSKSPVISIKEEGEGEEVTQKPSISNDSRRVPSSNDLYFSHDSNLSGLDSSSLVPESFSSSSSSGSPNSSFSDHDQELAPQKVITYQRTNQNNTVQQSQSSFSSTEAYQTTPRGDSLPTNHGVKDEEYGTLQSDPTIQKTQFPEPDIPIPKVSVPEIPADVPHDETKKDLRREPSLASPGDAEERANRIKSFYKDYFDQYSDGPIAMLNKDQKMRSSEYVPELPRLNIPNTFPNMPPRAISSPNMRTHNQVQPSRSPETQDASFYGNPFMGNMYGNSSFNEQQSLDPIVHTPLPPLEPLSPLPTPSAIGEDDILASPTTFAPQKRVHVGPAMTLSAAGNPNLSAQQWRELELRELPPSYMLRNSALFNGLEFTKPKKFNQALNDSNGFGERSIRQQYSPPMASPALFTDLVPMNKRDDLKPQWDMNR
ncbi:hypothetical protein V1511DRAFT_486112 [Dipodascopsis uninucleata]